MVSLGFFFRHDLHRDTPLREITLGDGLEKVALRVVGVNSSLRTRCLAGEILNALLGLEMPFHIEEFVLGIDQAEGVAAETVHVAITVGRTAIGKQDGDLMQRFRRKRPEIPHHGGRF